MNAEFQQFLGIKLITLAPYHPSTNGLTEKAAQIIKKSLKKITDDSIKSRLAIAYRLSTTGSTPS